MLKVIRSHWEVLNLKADYLKILCLCSSSWSVAGYKELWWMNILPFKFFPLFLKMAANTYVFYSYCTKKKNFTNLLLNFKILTILFFYFKTIQLFRGSFWNIFGVNLLFWVIGRRKSAFKMDIEHMRICNWYIMIFYIDWMSHSVGLSGHLFNQFNNYH